MAGPGKIYGASRNQIRLDSYNIFDDTFSNILAGHGPAEATADAPDAAVHDFPGAKQPL